MTDEIKKEFAIIRDELEIHADYIRVHEARWKNTHKLLVETGEACKGLSKREAINTASAIKVNRVLTKIGSHAFSIQHYDKLISEIKRYNTKLSKRVLELEKKKSTKEFKEEHEIKR